MIGEVILIFVVAFTIYMLIRISKSRDDQIQNDQQNRVYKRIFFGGFLGFILGFGIAFLRNPPYKGIWETPSDVQGLVVASWFVCGGLGAVVFALAGFFKRKTKN